MAGQLLIKESYVVSISPEIIIAITVSGMMMVKKTKTIEKVAALPGLFLNFLLKNAYGLLNNIASITAKKMSTKNGLIIE
jgi:hypothetical protein